MNYHKDMRKLTVILAILIISLSAFAQGRNEMLTVAIDMDEKDQITINPYTVSDSNSVIIMQNLWSGLFEYDSKTSEAKPAIATRWTVSDNGLVWTFRLRDAKFSDGNSITSTTFVNSWNYLAQSVLSSKVSFIERNHDNTLNLETPDKRTLVVHLIQPVAYLPSILCQVCLAAIDPNNSSRFSGAYTVVSRDANTIMLKSNKRYWDVVKTENVCIKTGTDFNDQFRNGEIQFTNAWIDDAEKYMITNPIYGSTFFYFNAQNTKFETLASSVDWNFIRDFQNQLFPMTSLVPNSQATYHLPDYQYNPNIGDIKIGVYRGEQNYFTAQIIQGIWTKMFNTTVYLDSVPVSTYSNYPKTNPYDFCLMTWIADYVDPMAFLSLFDSNATYNLANFDNKEFDRLIRLSQFEIGEQRLETLRQAEQLLLDSSIVIPMSQTVVTNFVRTDLISGWYENPLDIHPLKSIFFK